jgi:hypothetical protein
MRLFGHPEQIGTLNQRSGQKQEMRVHRRRKSKKTITSDHGGFAGVQPSAMQSSPANNRSPELSCLAQLFSDERPSHRS